MLCSKCGRKIPEGQEVSRGGFHASGSTWSRGGIMCKKCAFAPFYKKWWFWMIVIFFVLVFLSSLIMMFGKRGIKR